MRNTGSVEIDRPIHEVFRLTNEHVAEWSIIVVEDEVLDEKPEGVGTTFRTVTEENGKRMECDVCWTLHPVEHYGIGLVRLVPLKLCQGCKKRVYCSVACQTTDWKLKGHSKQCKQK